MRILVTGPNGFIARHLIKRLGQHQIKTTSRDDDVVLILNDFRPELIIHLGAELKDESKMFGSNVCLTMKFLEWVRLNSKTKLVLFGTSSEYGHSNKPRAETDCPCPDSIYEGTKAATAMLARAWSKTYGLDILFIRPFTIYGSDEKPNKLSQILFKKWKDQTTLRLSDGMHDYVYIDDFLDVLCELIFQDFQKFEIINIGSGVQHSNYEFVRIFQKVTGHTFSIELIESKDPTMWVCDNSRFTFPPLESGIRRMIAEYIENAEAL